MLWQPLKATHGRDTRLSFPPIKNSTILFFFSLCFCSRGREGGGGGKGGGAVGVREKEIVSSDVTLACISGGRCLAH